ncbi:uncharacterized protein LOC143018276 isoform X2 [Oratosquilla oratoria]
MPGSVRCSVGPDGYDDQVSPPSSNYGGSTSSGPTRSNSIDSLPTNDKQVADYIPMRLTRPSPKTNVNAMQFVKVGPAVLHKTASEQLKKVEATKAMRKQIITEEEDWQSQTTDDRNSSLVEVTDWQSNLDKWKSSRRKRNEGALERVLEIKKNEVEDELGKTRRKSKTFSEMREEKRGRRFNLVVHDDDNNDLGDLGLSTYNDGTDTQGVKDVDQTYPVEDNKDAKSDAGFCTGSDTGSDGVFPEDNISDTSSALGDKKEAHDSLLDAGISKEEELHINGSMSSPVTSENSEYTYDKAIESYKQFAENSVKKRTSSITSLTSITSNNREDDYLSRNGRSASPSKTKIEDKLNFFKKEMKKEEVRPTIEPRVILRDKSPKVDVGKRRSMFEIGDPTLVSHETKVSYRRSLDVTTNLRTKVASFENVSDAKKVRGVTPPRDAKFHEKLATFTQSGGTRSQVRKKTPERDANFRQKLASFHSIENGEEKPKERRVTPQRDPSLKNKIASFEQLEQAEKEEEARRGELKTKALRDRSMSLDHLDDSPVLRRPDEVMRGAVSVGNILKTSERKPAPSMGVQRVHSVPYVEVSLEDSLDAEEEYVRSSRAVVSSESKQGGGGVGDGTTAAKRSTVYETVEVCHLTRDVESAPLYSIFQYLSPEVNAQVFELASRLEETPLVDNEEQPGMVGNVNETATVDHQDEFVRKVELVTVEETLDQHLYAQEPMEQVSPYNAPPEACPPVAPVLKQQQDAVDAPVAPILWQLQNDSVAPDPHPPLLQPLQPQLYQDDQHLEVEDNGKVYSDEDINEVINEYDGIDVPEDEKHETETCTENIYENITEEPLYENIYEKIDDTPEEPLQNEPHYQTIDEVHEATVIQEEKTVSKTTNHFVNSDPMEVLDVTWTEGSSLAAPPSEPPPPPPPDTEDDSDNSIEELVKDPKPQQSENFIRENSTRRIKKELWRRRSDFLGTSSKFVEEEQAVRPPPDLTELLRQEREAERRLLEAHSPQPFRSQPLVPQPPAPQELNEAEIVRREREIIESLERSEQQQQQQHLQQQHQEDLQASHDTNADLRGGEIQNPEAPLLRQDPYQEHTQYHQEHLEYQEDALTPQDSSPSEVKILTSETSANTEDNKISVCETPASTVQNVEPLPSPVLRDIEPPPSPTEPLTEHLEPRPFSDPNAEVITKAEEQPPGGDVSCSKTVARHQPETPEKLAELEAEMLEHDKAMLQRAGHSPSSPLPEAQHEPVTNFKPTPTADLPIQEFYTAPTFQPTPPPNFKSSSPPDTIGMLGMTLEHSASVGQLSSSVPNYTNLTAHPFSRSHSHTNLGAPTPYKSPPRVPKHQAPEPLPRKKKMPPPPPVKPAPAPAVPAPPPAVQQSVERQEAIRLSRQPTSALSEQPTEANTDNTSPSSPGGGQQMTKQTILALSAIPKPRLTDGDSWIMKRKQDSHRDYSKHWLLQEAEQRRIEQQERVQRPKTLHTSASQSPTMSSHHRVTTPPALHPVTTPPALHPVNTPPALHPASSQSTAHPVSIPPALHPVYTSSNSHSSSRTTSNNSNSSSNSTSNKWRNQATTYQPLAPPAKTGTDKPLPDSIIHSLTQRVNSRSINSNNNINNYSNANGRTSNYNSNYRDENYHDYMNADALSTVPTHTPLYQSSTSTPSPQHSAPSSSPQHLHHQQQQQTQDQKLLSVSGKKKCSHCTEELGRGAAMIIESLRLFYHIPCFKCCVCGIQLGNGSAGADVRVRNHKLHCHNCYSNDEGMKFSKV